VELEPATIAQVKVLVALSSESATTIGSISRNTVRAIRDEKVDSGKAARARHQLSFASRDAPRRDYVI
jgi:hypothetical protein